MRDAIAEALAKADPDNRLGNPYWAADAVMALLAEQPVITFVDWLAYEHLDGIFEGDAMLVDGPVLEPRPTLEPDGRYALVRLDEQD